MKPKCKTCSKVLVAYSAKHCRSHRPITKKTRKLLSKLRQGNTYGFKKGQSAWNKGISAFWVQGEKNPNWGKFGPNHPKWTGRTELTKLIRRCPKYKAWRFSIFQRDNFTCQLCFKKGVYLEADHYPIGFALILREYKVKTYQEAMNCTALWNALGRTLCSKCHPRPGRLPRKDR